MKVIIKIGILTEFGTIEETVIQANVHQDLYVDADYKRLFHLEVVPKTGLEKTRYEKCC